MSEPPPPTPGAPSPRHVGIVIALLFAVSLLRGLRMPNLWSATHMTFNYSHGFIRRGLVGEVLLLVSGGRLFKYYILVTIAGVLFAVGAWLMARAIRRALRTDPGDACLAGAMLVFAASPAVVLMAHLIGYTDHIGLILLLAFVLRAGRRAGRPRRPYAIFYVAAAIGVLMALIHENLVTMFMPVMLFAMICHIVALQQSAATAAATARPRRWLLVAHAAGATLVALAASVIAGAKGTRSPAAIHALGSSIVRLVDFPPRGDAFEALARPVRDNLLSLMPGFWRERADMRGYLVLCTVVSIPAVGYLLVYGVRLIGRLGLPPLARWALALTLIGTALAPLTLNFVGWDVARWSAIGAVSPFVCVLCLRLVFSAHAADPAAHRVPSRVLPLLAVVGVVLELAIDMTRFFFDGYVAHTFPYVRRFEDTMEIIRSGFRWLPPG